ncbi:hypothetical protein [Ralstonia mannitolilytica]|uniref:hypothetical protein n=1 Tax=Ralstonia mannitolilytica TaxID=105219 RepID=UPI00292F7FD9|nr:hypothetical protein [Ralstonia mannitolilytica]
MTSTTAITAPAQPSTSFHSTTATAHSAAAALHNSRPRPRVGGANSTWFGAAA